MPTYDYQCKCGNIFEKFQFMSAKPVTVCPKCGRTVRTRLIGAGSGIIFKGWFPGQEIARKEQNHG